MPAHDERFPMGATITLGDLSGDQHPVLARLRAAEPVSWLPAIDGWLVTRRATALAVMRDPVAFTVDDPRFTTARVVGPSMLSLDGADHERHRVPFVPPYRRGALGPVNAWIEAEARRLTQRLAPAGHGELRTQLAAPLATSAIHRSLGLVGTDPSTMLRWYRAIADSVSALSAGEPIGDGPAAMDELRAAVDATLESDPDAPLSRLVTDDLTRAEVAQNVAIVLFGAIETAEGMTANALWHLLCEPGLLDDVRQDPTLVENLVEESLRLEPAASVVDRYATCDCDLDGAPVRTGDLVRVSLSAANRDPQIFTEPDGFRIRRPNARQHLAFAAGPHLCIGLLMARMETTAAVRAVLELLPGAALDRTASAPPSGLIFRKPEAVVARW